jgi:hypothetical protein
MVDPESHGKHAPAFDLAFLRENLTHIQQTRIYDKWIVWHTSEAEELQFSDADIDEMVEASKKNDISFWINAGSTKLISCVHILASKVPEDYQTDKSLDT